MTCYRVIRGGERLRLVRKKNCVNVFECLDRPMQPNCQGEMEHPRIIISDVRLKEIAKECKGGKS